MVPEFHDFPSTAITVEFWMRSVDTCRPGVPFSYAHGRYEQEDNSFLVFNYNSWWGGGVVCLWVWGAVLERRSPDRAALPGVQLLQLVGCPVLHVLAVCEWRGCTWCSHARTPCSNANPTMPTFPLQGRVRDGG